jgi:hypothetical protein
MPLRFEDQNPVDWSAARVVDPNQIAALADPLGRGQFGLNPPKMPVQRQGVMPQLRPGGGIGPGFAPQGLTPGGGASGSNAFGLRDFAARLFGRF